MLGIELTERQNKIWAEVGERLAAGLPIRHLALQYYLQYRESLQQKKIKFEDEEHIANLLQIAYFISQKNQLTFNVRGERVAGVALSINEIIKKNNDFEDFIYHMKEMLKVITIEDRSVEQQIESCLKRFKFTMTFYHKFTSTFKKIAPLPADTALLQSLLWLVFIICKQKLPVETDLISATCLIAYAFTYFVREQILVRKSDLELKDQLYGGRLSKESVEHVFLEYFRIKDMAKYEQLVGPFSTQIQEIKSKVGVDYLFSDKHLESAYRKVDYIYQKRLTGDSIDERHFLKERVNTILNANRFTPFGGVRAGNLTKNQFVPNQILSHRVLNYEQVDRESDLELEAIKQNREKSGPTLLKNLMGNKTPSKTPLIKATPMTNAMEMYNWVLEKSNYHKYVVGELPEKLGLDEKGLKLVNGLWKDICMSEAEREEITKVSCQAILALSTEIVMFVTNQQGSFENLVSLLSLSWFSVWSKIDSVLKYDTRMPTSIKVHLLSLETTLVSKRLWGEQICPGLFVGEQLKENPEYERLFKRVIHEIVYQVYFLCKRLEVKEPVMNSIFLLSQYAVGEYNELLRNRNLYQLILCSCYAVSRAQEVGLSFYSILIAFRDLNNLSKEAYQELTEEIYMDTDSITDIITFYNSCFIKHTKSFLVQLKYDSTSTAMSDITTQKNIINSPVKDLLSKNLVTMAEKNKTPQQTPFTQALMAYNESPLLKEKRMKNLASCIDGQRLLERKESGKGEALKQASVLIGKKWRNCKSPESRFGSTVRKADV